MSDCFEYLPGLSRNHSSSLTTRPCYVMASPIDVSSGCTIPFVHMAPWVFLAVCKLETLESRKEGWDSYGGLPLQSDARELTVHTIKQLGGENLPVPSVVLGSDGTVQLEWRKGGRELDLDLTDKDRIEFVKCDPNGEMEDGFTDSQSSVQLRRLATWLLDK